jgi:hypothetical protein
MALILAGYYAVYKPVTLAQSLALVSVLAMPVSQRCSPSPVAGWGGDWHVERILLRPVRALRFKPH